MIESLELVNFQTHKKSLFEFHPGINVITGKSDEGKSSVIRAIYWLLFNKPSGNEFINWAAKKCTVTAEINANTIVREKSNNGTNKYIVNDNEFNATRTDVPEQVKELTKLTSTNIQMQDDPYFMLSLNSGDVGRKLNEVVGLNQIDKSIRYVNGVHRKSNNKYNHIKEDVSRLEKQLANYSELDAIAQLNEKYTSLEDKYERINDVLDTIDELIDDLEALSNLKDETESLNALAEEAKEYVNKDQYLTDTLHSIDKIADIISSIKNDSSTIETLNAFQKEIDSYLKKYLSQEQQYDEAHYHVVKADQLINAINNAAQEVEQTQLAVHEVERQFGEFKETIKECPLCERPFF